MEDCGYVFETNYEIPAAAKEKIDKAMKNLSETERTILTRFLFEGLSMNTIAEQLNLMPVQVPFLKFLAMTKLCSELKKP